MCKWSETNSWVCWKANSEIPAFCILDKNLHNLSTENKTNKLCYPKVHVYAIQLSCNYPNFRKQVDIPLLLLTYVIYIRCWTILAKILFSNPQMKVETVSMSHLCVLDTSWHSVTRFGTENKVQEPFLTSLTGFTSYFGLKYIGSESDHSVIYTTLSV